jgi:transposase InsO family protein
MSWKHCNAMSQRQKFIELATLPGANKSELCRRFEISRETAHKWLRRYRKDGQPGLLEQSRRPRRCPGRTAARETAAILALRAEHPSWGPRKLRARLQSLDPLAAVPARSTIGAILGREGQIDPRASQAAKAWQRFEHATANALWQMDFKGYFALGDATRCHPLTVLDDHSRYLVGLRACSGQRTEIVQGHLESLFRVYGLPASILCDNGSPWAGPGGEYTALSVWLLLLGVRVRHGRPFHPQTQGKDERFHRTLKADLLSRRDFHTLDDVQPCFDQYRQIYNRVRPHQALDDVPPASRYVPSTRPWRPIEPAFEYAPEAIERTVKTKGEITFANRFFYLGQAFRGQRIALLPAATDGVYEVRLHAYPVGQIDLRVPNSKPKGNYYPMEPLVPFI